MPLPGDGANGFYVACIPNLLVELLRYRKGPITDCDRTSPGARAAPSPEGDLLADLLADLPFFQDQESSSVIDHQPYSRLGFTECSQNGWPAGPQCCAMLHSLNHRCWTKITSFAAWNPIRTLKLVHVSPIRSSISPWRVGLAFCERGHQKPAKIQVEFHRSRRSRSGNNHRSKWRIFHCHVSKITSSRYPLAN